MIDAPIIQGFCNACDDEHGWSTAIAGILSVEFADVNLEAGVPANDPFWVRWNELYAQHDQPVADFSYDDRGYALCAKHLRALADSVEAS